MEDLKSQDVLLAYITRLNLNFERSSKWQGLDEKWISVRLDLMQRFLIPSLKAQHDQDFVWLMLVHPDTPENILEQTQIIPQCRILKTESDVSTPRLFATQSVEYLQDNFDRKLLITVRIDSDDGVNPWHGSILKDFAMAQTLKAGGLFTDFPYGSFFNVSTGRGYLRRSPSRSCGISKIEHLNSEATTIYCGHHEKISSKGNCITIKTGEPMWIQTTHESHINRPGKKLPRIRLRRGTGFETRKIRKIFPSIDLG